jgi:tetratricopeptide (TPR) repeat protein
MLVERTGGNPFFLEESVRMLIETGALRGGTGQYALAAGQRPVDIPPTVEAMLAARADRLPDDEKELLRAAAVIGHEVPLALLKAVVGLSEESIRRGLLALQTAEFLFEVALAPEPGCRFKHALTREVTYASLAPEWRQDAHARIVAAIEQLWPDRLDAHAERLAHHAYLGHVWDKAARYLREAGTKAFERSANRAAVSLLDRALTALGHLPQNDDTRQQAFAVHLDLRSSLYALGEFDRVVHHLEAAKAAAESLGDRRRLGLVYGHWAPFSDMAGDHHHALASGERALALADSLEDHRARVVGTYSVGLTNIYLGNYRAAADSLRRTIGLLDPDAVTERFGMAFPAAVAARAYLGLALAELGAFADATAIGGHAVEIAEAIKHPQSRIFAAYHLGYDYLRQGNFEAAIRILEQALVLVDEADCPGHLPSAACIAGTAYARGGRLDAGLELVKRGVEASKSMNIRGARSLHDGGSSIIGVESAPRAIRLYQLESPRLAGCVRHGASARAGHAQRDHGAQAW